MNNASNPKQTSPNRLESGQAIVVMALLMLALIAFLGLAIDGGGLYFLYRDTQNAADASVIAATYARCTNGDIVFAGLQAAAANGFDNNETTNWVEVNYPPTSGTGEGDPDYVEVNITANKPSYFIQLVYPEQLRVTSKAVGRCSPPFDPATLPAVWAGSLTCQNGFNWTGSEGTVEGGVFSNNEVKFGGGGQGNTVIGPVRAVNDVDDTGNTTYSEPYEEGVDPEDDPLSLHFALEDFAPDGRIAQRAALYYAIASPDDDPDMKATGTWDPANGRVLEGLYYVDGDVHIGSGVDYGPSGITIVATGEISFSGGVALQYYIDGFLLVSGYEAENCGDNAISITGAGDYWYGVIYAPQGGVNISASDIAIVGSIIADTIDISGSTLDITADPDILPPFPAGVVVAE